MTLATTHLKRSARLSAALAIALLLALGVGDAAAKPAAQHHKKAKPRAAALRVTAASTADTNGEGHINEISLKLSAPPETRGLASAFSVAGYQIGRAVAHGDKVTLELVPHTAYDTGARPVVTVHGLRGRNGARLARMVLTPTDGAAPVLVTASTADLIGSGRLDAINLLFSEPVSVGSGAVQVQGYQVTGTRDYPDGLLTVLLQSSGQADTASVPLVTLNGAELRDDAGNPGPSGAVGVTAGAAPVMVGAIDEGFWLNGEKVETIWSAPVHASGAGGADSFAMTSPEGTPIYGQALGAGDAPNEIAVDLPLGSETPAQIAYTAAGSTVIVDGDGHPGVASRAPITVTQAPPQFAGTLTDPFNQDQMMPFGERSFYLQPWRSYTDTFPATTMLNAVGINFNVAASDTSSVDAGAELLHAAGFTHARMGIPWNDMSYSNPGQINSYYMPSLTNELDQLKANGVRPLILLQSNDQIPTPVQSVTLNVTSAAPAGATTIQLDAASAALVQPGLTGFNQYGMDGGVLITAVNGSDVATLSQPLQSAIPTGETSAVDLAFQPFFPEYNTDGSLNANNQSTMAGWLQYVAGVTQTVKSILGSDNFDVEVWNELTFGSDFLSASNYYNPAPQGSGNTDQELLQDTVAYIRNPANGLPDVGIGDGFANEEPWTSGSNEVAGVTAIDKHPYQSAVQFPSQATFNGVAPLDAFGNVDGTEANGIWTDTYVPTFTMLFPEYYLSGIGTETVTRDLAPFLSDVYGTLHGRGTHPVGAAAPQMWVTEVNLDASTVNDTLTSPDGSATSPMSAADLSHFEAKAILRYLASWVGKGTSVIDFYAADDGGLSLVDPSFWTAADATGSYPGLAAGGDTMVAVSRFLASMAGAQNLSQTNPITLDSISDYDGAYQFPGNGTAAYPPLYNRDMIGFFPFQVNAHKWVIPTYVMTLDLATLYNKSASASDVTRADLPQEVYRFTLSGVNPATASASATDPLTGSSVPVKITGRGSNSISLEIPLTDYPRMLTLTDG